MWRNRCTVISDITQSTMSAFRAVTTVFVMKSETGCFKTSGPARPTARMRSRSDTMPATLPSSSSMTMQPMPCCASSFAISSNDLSLVVVTTPLRLSFRIAATFISFPPAVDFRPR
jgi:hypothetical protein